MSTTERQYLLSTDDHIKLKEINLKDSEKRAKSSTEFSILSVVGKGGSSVCYEAYCESNGTTGRLKEFYPIIPLSEKETFLLHRNNDNLLVAPSTVKDSFDALKSDFIDAYCNLAKARNDSKTGKVLNNYIPPFALYEGLSVNGRQASTVYVWTSQDKNIIVFEDYLKKMREDLEKYNKPEHYLFNILTAILKLTECIGTLHSLDLIHMDIKPGNFGLAVDKNGKIEASNISLFDVNTIYPINSPLIRIAGTEDFSDPKIWEGEVSIRSDIYSIGATLFNSIVVYDGFDGIYKKEYYDDIDSYISNSKLIKCSDNNSNSALHDVLSKILKTCLAYDTEKRYDGCSYLADDLESARAYMLPEEARKTLIEKGHIDLEKYLDKEISSGAVGAIQKLLYELPLYDKASSENIDVLVLGAGTYAQKFIDLAFEAAQMENSTLRITAVSNNVTADKERYLNSRPAFTEFFTVDGISPAGESLGNLDFVPIDEKNKSLQFTRKNTKKNKDIINKILLDNEERHYSYIFIALGDDELNYCVADECTSCNEVLNHNSNVCFAWYGAEREFNTKAIPVYIHNVISDTDYYTDLKRMALNCHLLWSNSLNIDLQKKKAEFSNPYNFNSSFSNILSIKYKLHSIGIDNMDNHFDAARRFEEICNTDKNAVTALVKAEHRRWMVSYICQGWEAMHDYTSLISDTKDKKNKKHPCLVHSNGKTEISLPVWKNNGYEKWDTASEKELANLDGLDRMSVELHRHFKKLADSIKNTSAVQKDIDIISGILKYHPEILKAFDKYVLCLTEIIEGKHKQTRQYDYYFINLKKKMKNLPEDLSKDLEKKIDGIKETFYSVLQSHKYIDFKAYDRDLVVGIPFILTYSTSIRLCVPFGIEEKGDINNRLLFGNVASALALNPSVITYVIDAEDVAVDEEKFNKSLSYALNCIQNRNMQAKINLLFIQPLGVDVVNMDFKEKIKTTYSRVGSIEIIEYENDTLLKNQLAEYIKAHQKNKTRCFSAIEKNSTGISKLMRGLGCYESVPSFKYDSVKCEFNTDSRCEYLKYVKCINPNDYLRVSDMFDFRAAESSSTLPEMQLDYEFFWKLYKSPNIYDRTQQNEKVWKNLCKTLKEHDEKTSLLLSVKIPSKDEKTLSAVTESVFFIPSLCRDTVEKILIDMKNISVGFTGDDYSVTYYNSSTYKVVIKTTPEVTERLDELFSNPYVLYNANNIRVEKDKNYVKIYFDSLKVEKLNKRSFISDKQDTSLDFEKRCGDILKKLKENRYISNFRETQNGNDTLISFTYSSPQIKSLLTREGRILEIYVYYKALEQNYFDDIANSCEIVWNKDNVSNEFDIVLTKGYKSLIVECKAQTQLKQDFYYKLSQLNRQFGINTLPVLVADTIENNQYDNSANEMQRSRGDEYGITTIYKPEDINEKSQRNSGIGATLRKIMEDFSK